MTNQSARYLSYLAIILLAAAQHLAAQTYEPERPRSLEWNFNLDLEATRGGSLSHYFYNEVHRNTSDWAFDLARADLILALPLGEHWTWRGQITADRRNGLRWGLGREVTDYRLQLAQLSFTYRPKERPWSVVIGQQIIPFGRFFTRQLYWQRDQLMTPLAYSYYTNVSENIGYVPDLRRFSSLVVDGDRQWGSPLLYNYGYQTGVSYRRSWENGAEAALAVVSSSPNVAPYFFDPPRLGVIARGSYPFSPAFEVGASASLGNFLRESPFTAPLDAPGEWTQLLLGLDYQWASGFWSVSGEAFWAHYRVPTFDAEQERYLGGGDAPEIAALDAYSTYAQVTYEPPYLSGAQLSFRSDVIFFGDGGWSDDVWRNSVSVAYLLTEQLTLHSSFSRQDTRNRPWTNRQNLFRLLLSLHL